MQFLKNLWHISYINKNKDYPKQLFYFLSKSTEILSLLPTSEFMLPAPKTVFACQVKT